MKFNGNYSFGGKTPIKMNKSKSNTNYIFDEKNTPLKIDFNKSFSIYDIVN